MGPYGFMVDNKESTLEIVEPVPIKARDLFLRIKKKIGPLVSLESAKQTVLPSRAVVMKEKPNPQEEGSPPRNGREKALRRQAQHYYPVKSKRQGGVIFLEVCSRCWFCSPSPIKERIY